MNPADKRLSELLDKWLTSLELHLKYSGLDEDSYRKIQPWPPHDRPSRWIVELARQKLLSLKEQHDSRVAMGDAKFADALESMQFLSNLVGAENIKRFIPLADPTTEVQRGADLSSTSQKTVMVPIVPGADTTQISALITKPHKMIQAAHDVTREMPQPQIGKIAVTEALQPSAPRKSAGSRSAAKTSHRRESRESRTSVEATAQREKLVLDDATRLLGWGRKWHELAELISRMADRPSVTEVRRILREHKTELE